MRVLIARPAAQAEATALRLSHMGHQAVIAPVLTIVATGHAPPAEHPDALLVTSRNAVSALAPHRARFAATPVFAVGPRTATSLAETGFTSVTTATGDSEALAKAVMAGTAPGARLLHVAGHDRRPEPARSLRAAGYEVAIWEAYAAEPAGTLPEAARAALAGGGLDAVLHYSPRSAALLLRLCGEAGLADAFTALRHLCLSTNVAAALEGATPRLAVASAPEEDRLLGLLDEAAARTD